VRDGEIFFSQRRKGAEIAEEEELFIFGVYLMLKNYKEYKDINLPWLKSIPSHWDIKRAKGIFIPINERSQSGKEELLSVSSKHGVIKRENANVTMFMAGSYENYKLCWVNDLVINSLWAWQTGLGFSPYHGIISTAYSVFRLNKSDKNCRYLNYLLRGTDYQWEFQVRSKGIWRSRYQLSDNSFLDSPVILPPLSEQDQIVQYLDWKVSLINKYINTKKKQIELLKEQKQAIINKAITKGLNPKVSMKDSGIEWLGKIPKHWEVMKLKHFALVNPSIRSFSYKDNDIVVFLPMENISTDGKIDNSIKKRVSEVKTGFSSFAKNDVIIAKITPCFENGKGAYLNELESEVGFGTTELFNLRAKENILPEYLYWITMSSQFRILGERGMTGTAGQKRITSNFVSCFTIAIPDIEEQKRIIEYIKKNILKINTLLNSADKEVSFLQEYRTRLISDVVTGKVDVQGIKVPEVSANIEDMLELGEDNENNKLED